MEQNERIERIERDDVQGYLIHGILVAVIVVEVAVGAAVVIGSTGPEVSPPGGSPFFQAVKSGVEAGMRRP